VRLRDLSVLGVLVPVLMVAGCGGSAPSSPAVNEAAFPFGSPALVAGRLIPARYKCDVKNVWLPLRWGSLPPRTQELALYIIRFANPKLAKGGTAKAEILATAVVVGITPKLRGLSPGKYPPGALVGVHEPNNAQASICPPKGVTENLLFRLYAMPRKLGLRKGSGGANLVEKLRSEALGAGAFIASYRPA
jgi:phosphatidylethanolamine-binding protein (PEBP) family uncharacterized protein